ncbi:MAG: phosphatidate cytidylyltransferase [Erysipelotrichaceae bacterium]|nr:phosphatidate cytidylyltransferase [Erysipelotrichaceae bacterium]
MKKRVISGAIIGIYAVICLYYGGFFYWPIVAFVGLCGTYEFCSTRNKPVNWIEYCIMVAYMVLLHLFPEKAMGLTLMLIIFLITLAIFDESVNFDDAAASFMETVILSFATYQMVHVQLENKWLMGYIVIIAFVTDVFALFTGMKFGRHKLNERVSPKKTVEGFIGGWLCGGLIAFIYACFCSWFGLGFNFILLCSIVLPVVSQIGDLAFSLIKRHYNIKDFSNIIPGHGGVMDRFDSLSFTLFVYGALSVFLI